MKNDKDLIFGIRTVIEAISAGKQVDKLLIKKGLQGELIQELMDLLKLHQLPFQYVPIEKINSITRKNHQGVVAFISPIEFQDIEQLVPMLFEQGENPLLLILDQVSDVRNFGAIVRTAECAKVNAVIIPQKGIARISSDAVKTSAGALHNIPICRVGNLVNTVKLLKNSGIQVVAATEKTEDLYFNIDYTVPTAIIMGSEDKGVSNELIRVSDKLAKIPILGEIDSLNVSVASSVVVYEAVKQRLIQA